MFFLSEVLSEWEKWSAQGHRGAEAVACPPATQGLGCPFWVGFVGIAAWETSKQIKGLLDAMKGIKIS